jgi:hypothetical protein
MTTDTAGNTHPRGGNLLRYPFSRQAARDAGYVLITLLTSIVAFTVLVTGVSLALSLAILIVGIPVAVGVAFLNRGVADLQRGLSGAVSDEPIRGTYRTPTESGLIARVKTTLTDPQTWRDIAWLVYDSIAGFASAVVGLVLWASVIASLTLPAWYWALENNADPIKFGLFQVHSTQSAFGAFAVGLAAFVPVAWLTRGLARGHAKVARALLG